MNKIALISYCFLFLSSLNAMKHIKRFPLRHSTKIGSALLRKQHYATGFVDRSYRLMTSMVFWNVERRGKKRDEELAAINFLQELERRTLCHDARLASLVYGVHAYRNYGKTSLLDIASRWSLQAITNYLLQEKKINPNTKLAHNRIALHNIGSSYMDLTKLAAIINAHERKGVDFEAIDDAGDTLIHTAPAEAINLLSAKGAPLNKPNNYFVGQLYNPESKKYIFKIAKKEAVSVLQDEEHSLNSRWDTLCNACYGLELEEPIMIMKEIRQEHDEQVLLQQSPEKIWCTPLVESIARADLNKMRLLLRTIAVRTKRNLYDILPFHWRRILEAGQNTYFLSKEDVERMYNACLQLESEGKIKDLLMSKDAPKKRS